MFSKKLFLIFMIALLLATQRPVTASQDANPPADDAVPTEDMQEDSDEEGGAVMDAASGVAKIVTACQDDNGNLYYVHTGNGFMIGSGGNDQYILTDYRLVTPSESDYEQIRHGVGINQEAKLTTRISLHLQGDVVIDATVAYASQQSGFALLKPASSVSNMTSLTLGDTSGIMRKDEVYLLGYSGEYSVLGSTDLPSFNIAVTPFNVAAIGRDPVSLELDYPVSPELCGAPLLDKEGNVIGMMSFQGDQEETLSVIPVETLIEMIKTLGIGYNNSSPTSSYNVADQELVENFYAVLFECQQNVMENEQNYSKKSLKKHKAAIAEALEVTRKTDATKDDYQDSIDNMKKTRKKLRPYNHTYHIWELILLPFLIIFFRLNLKQFLKGKRMKASVNPDVKKQKKSKQLGALIRVDSSEVIWLTKKGLTIGKNPKEVDYCIYHNPSVSRKHASIVYNQERFFLVDHHSTNRTSLNHAFLAPERPYELSDEDTISISDVAFHFRYLK